MGERRRLSRREFLKLGAAFAGAMLIPVSGCRPGPGSELDQFIRARMEAAHLPGLAACVVGDGRVVWANGYGWANVEKQVAVTPDTLFMLASVSKTITSVALMQLYDDGLFGLDDDVDDYLPFSTRNPRHPATPITPRMLLTHTSSLADNWDVIEPLYTPGDSPIPLGDFCAGYVTPGGEYYTAENFHARPPGQVCDYCNVGVALGGYLAQVLSGVPFEQHCEQRLFAPLGMEETSWRLAGLDAAHIATPYTYDDGQYTPYEHYGYPDYPDGALRTSVLQLARFLITFINGGAYGDTRILQASTVAEMRREQVPALEEGQGLIWYTEGERMGHDGGDDGILTRMFFRPTNGRGVILLSNGEGDTGDDALLEIENRLFEMEW